MGLPLPTSPCSSHVRVKLLCPCVTAPSPIASQRGIYLSLPPPPLLSLFWCLPLGLPFPFQSLPAVLIPLNPSLAFAILVATPLALKVHRVPDKLAARMDRNHRLEAIQEGKFLSLQSDVSIDSTAAFHDAHERPFVVPEHDPEGSIYKSRYSKYLASKQSLSQLTCSSSDTMSGAKGQYDNTTANESTHSPTPHPAIALRHGSNHAGLQGSPENPPPYCSPPPRSPSLHPNVL